MKVYSLNTKWIYRKSVKHHLNSYKIRDIDSKFIVNSRDR